MRLREFNSMHSAGRLQMKHQTLGNLSHLPPDLIDTIRRPLRGDSSSDSGAFEILRTYPHGHALATLGTLQRLGLESLLAIAACRAIAACW